MNSRDLSYQTKQWFQRLVLVFEQMFVKKSRDENFRLIPSPKNPGSHQSRDEIPENGGAWCPPTITILTQFSVTTGHKLVTTAFLFIHSTQKPNHTYIIQAETQGYKFYSLLMLPAHGIGLKRGYHSCPPWTSLFFIYQKLVQIFCWKSVWCLRVVGLQHITMLAT